VPPLLFGLFGLAALIATLPRSGTGSDMGPGAAPLIGGLTLALVTMPVVALAARQALHTVPLSIREAALAMGASRIQVLAHHVLPLALPGIATGAILGMARALGASAPLLMLGMAGGALPVQIFSWSRRPGFAEQTAAAVIVLLALVLLMQALAHYLRRRLEARW
jgi:phosphate transport system permease protein